MLVTLFLLQDSTDDIHIGQYFSQCELGEIFFSSHRVLILWKSVAENEKFSEFLRSECGQNWLV